jgi:hypothetical protein
MLVDQPFWYSIGLPARGPIPQVTSETSLCFGARDASTQGVSGMCLKGVDSTVQCSLNLTIGMYLMTLVAHVFGRQGFEGAPQRASDMHVKVG